MYIISLIKSLKPSRREHWMMLAILVYSLNGVLKYYLPKPICNAVMVLSAITFIWVVLKYISGFHLKGATGILYVFLILWSICITFHMFFIADVQGTFTVYNGIISLVSSYCGSPYFIPNLLPFIILALPRNYKFDYRYLWRVMWLMCIVYVCYYPFAFWSMTHYSWSYELADGEEWGDAGTYGDFILNSTKGIASIAPVVIMVYFRKYLKAKQWKWFLVVFVGSILLQAFMARRGGLAMSLLYLVMAWVVYSLNDKRTSKFKMILMAVLVVGLGFVLFTNFADSLFSTLMTRGADDTRSGVEENFYADMKSQSDWIFGRGWYGQYYDPFFGKGRSNIETGFLALILRGGFLYLIPYVAILGLTAFNGYFRSNNLFCKSLAVFCMMQIIALYPFGWPAFNFFHFIIWLSVWICNIPQMRNLTDRQISSLVFKG